jgi:hypothetical protein
MYRAYRARRQYRLQRRGAVVAQRLVRGFLARRHARKLRAHVALLQAAVRVALAVSILRGRYAEQTEGPEARALRQKADAAAREEIEQRQREAERLDAAKRKARHTHIDTSTWILTHWLWWPGAHLWSRIVGGCV